MTIVNDSYFKSGTWNVVCQVCGWKFKNTEVQKRWDGLYTCSSDFELRHPADYYKGPKENQPLPFTSPEPTDTFTDVTYSTATATVPAGTFTTNNSTL